VEICKKISRKCGVFFLSSGDFPSLMVLVNMHLAKHFLVEKIHKNLGDITHLSLLSVQHCDSFPYRYCIGLLFLYLFHHTW
jgi:hypothetical protein